MTLFKRGGVWWAYWWIDGVRSHASTGTGNKRLAQQIEQKLRDEAIARKHGLIVTDPHLTFGQLAARFIADAAPTDYQLGRLEELLPFFADREITTINKGHAAEYRLWRKRQKAVSDATVNRDLSVMRRILNWAVDNAQILATPFARLRLAPERKLKTRVLSVREEPLLLAACSAYFRPIVTMALDTGMRRGELLNQRWEDVDLDRKLLLVTKSKTITGEAREIPLSGRVYEFLHEQQKRDGYLFTYRKQPIHLVKTAWRGALERSGVRRLRFHDLRHTFATRLMEAGVVADVRRALMGHSAGNDIHSGYTHVELPAKREAVRRLELWIAEQMREFSTESGKEVAKTGNVNQASSDGAGARLGQRDFADARGGQTVPRIGRRPCRARSSFRARGAAPLRGDASDSPS